MFGIKQRKIHKLYSSNRKEKLQEFIKMEEVTKIISCILQFNFSAKFMATSLPNRVNNLSEGIHKIKFKYRHDNKKMIRMM